MSRRAAALLSCSLMATITSARGFPTVSSLGSSTDGALSATAASVSASSAVSEPGDRACHASQPVSMPEALPCTVRAAAALWQLLSCQTRLSAKRHRWSSEASRCRL